MVTSPSTADHRYVYSFLTWPDPGHVARRARRMSNARAWEDGCPNPAWDVYAFRSGDAAQVEIAIAA